MSSSRSLRIAILLLIAASIAAPASESEVVGAPSIVQQVERRTLDYLAGKWRFKYIGRRSNSGGTLQDGPREGTLSCEQRAESQTIEVLVEGRSDAGSYRESATLAFDEATNKLTVIEQRADGLILSSHGDWSKPVVIHLIVDPIEVNGRTLRMRRSITIVSANSFTLVEELAENDGPFLRLGSAIFTRSGAKGI